LAGWWQGRRLAVGEENFIAQNSLWLNVDELWDCYAVLVVGGNIIVQQYLNFGGVAMGQVN
jgi:hypothetical protein